MTLTPATANRRLATTVLLLGAATLSAPALGAQSATPPAPRPDPGILQTRYYTLHYATRQNDANELITGLRLILDPSVKLYLVDNQRIIIVRAAPDQLAIAEKLLAETDKPHKSYKLTYIITERDGTRTVGLQRFSMLILAGGFNTLKTGSKVPVATGSTVQDSHVQSQFTYLDIGLNLEAGIDASQDEVRLNSKIEQSSIADDRTAASNQQDPIVRQTVLQGSFTITPGKTTSLGSIDTPGSTRHLDIEAMIEPAK